MIPPMEAWRYWVIIGICLCVAAYMFLSLFYPPLRWMFRLKRSASYVLNVDEDQNTKFGNTLGLVLAPIIGVVMLGFSVTAFIEMRSSERRSVERGVAAVAKKKKYERFLGQALSEWKVSRVYLYDRRKRRDADSAGILQSEKFVRALAEFVDQGVVLEKPKLMQSTQDMLSIELKNEPSTDDKSKRNQGANTFS